MSIKKRGKLDRIGWARWQQLLAQTFQAGRRGLAFFCSRRWLQVGAFSLLILMVVGWGIGRRIGSLSSALPLVVKEAAVSADAVPPAYESLVREIQADLAALRAQIETEDPVQATSEAESGPTFTPLQLIPPVAGQVIKRSGWEKKADEWRYHSGIDLAVPPGTPVVAAAAGTVEMIKTDAALGTIVVVDHGQDWQSLYGHLTRILVSAGQEVTQGMLLGYSSRASCGPAPGIHFNLYHQKNPVDPLTMLNSAQD